MKYSHYEIMLLNGKAKMIDAPEEIRVINSEGMTFFIDGKPNELIAIFPTGQIVSVIGVKENEDVKPKTKHAEINLIYENCNKNDPLKMWRADPEKIHPLPSYFLRFLS